MAAKIQRQSFVLVAVLIVIMLASMVAISLVFRLKAEATAANAGAGSEQAWAAAISGLAEAMHVAATIVPGSLDWQDDPATFRDRLVADDGAEQWYFSVFAGGLEGGGLRYGLTDEAGKLHLDTTNTAALARLPGMSTYLAEGILDFLDADNTPRAEGAEQEYYDALAKPYAARNGPLASIDELLLVRGITPDVLYGEDVNLNGLLDVNEDDADAQFPPDNKDGKLERGLRSHVTLYAYDLNIDNDGLPRVDLNDTNEIAGDKSYPAELVQYIQALRRSNVTVNHPADLLEAKAKLKNEQGQEVDMNSGVGKEQLPALLDYFTATFDFELPGLVNVNTASALVLQSLPEVDEALATSIVSARASLRPEQRRTPAWLYQEDLVPAEKFKQLAPLITARSYQYHVQVVGYGVPSGRFRVLEAIIDVAGAEPTIVYLRDLTRLGLPFRIATDPFEEFFYEARQTRPSGSRLPGHSPGRRIHARQATGKVSQHG